MMENRLHPYFSPAAQNAVIVVPNNGPTMPANGPLPTATANEIYRAAFQRAQQDYELNRLFNPEFYEDGGGI